MTVLIDPPDWAGRGGTHWSHLVSDVSARELRDFAEAVGLPRRAFDVDHYDVPADRYDEMLAAGARPVPSRELLARLVGAGLRVRQVDKRRQARRQRALELRLRWRDLAGPHSSPWPGGRTPEPEEWAALGRRLRRRWSESHRRYHDLHHLHETLLAVDALAGPEGATTTERMLADLATWFHDAVYDAVPGRDEERSAALAETELAAVGVPAGLVEGAARLVRMTATHEIPARSSSEAGSAGHCHVSDHHHQADPGLQLLDSAGQRSTVGEATVGEATVAGAAALLLDADLAILAAPPRRYAAYADGVRAEYAAVPERTFRAGRADVLARLLTRERLYVTATAQQRWEAAARANLTAELARLRA